MKLFKFITFCFAALMFAALVTGFIPPVDTASPSAAIAGMDRGKYAEKHAENILQPTVNTPLTASYEISSPSISSLTGLRLIKTGPFNFLERTANSRSSPDNRVDEAYLSPPDVLPDRTAGPNPNFNNSYFEGFGSSNRARAKI